MFLANFILTQSQLSTLHTQAQRHTQELDLMGRGGEPGKGGEFENNQMTRKEVRELGV